MISLDRSLETFDDWLPEALLEVSDSEPAWLAGLRQEARDRLRREPLPGRRQETWRYSNPRSLLEQRFSPVEDASPVIGPGQWDGLAVSGPDAWRVVLVNGRFDACNSRLQGLPDVGRTTRSQNDGCVRRSWHVAAQRISETSFRCGVKRSQPVNTIEHD